MEREREAYLRSKLVRAKARKAAHDKADAEQKAAELARQKEEQQARLREREKERERSQVVASSIAPQSDYQNFGAYRPPMGGGGAGASYTAAAPPASAAAAPISGRYVPPSRRSGPGAAEAPAPAERPSAGMGTAFRSTAFGSRLGGAGGSGAPEGGSSSSGGVRGWGK